MKEIYEDRIKTAHCIYELADMLRMKKILIKDIPFETVFAVINTIYADRVVSIDECISMYLKMFNQGVEKQDINLLCAALEMLANHIQILTCLDATYDVQKEELSKNRCKLSYNLNRIKLMKNGVEIESKSNRFKGKGVVYSAITGGYDDVKTPLKVDPNFDYILFTDNPNIRSDVWQVRMIDNPDGLDNVRLARKIKILTHEFLPEYDYSIWIDGKLQIIGELSEYIEQYKGSQGILCFSHYVNDCVYGEMRSCVSLNKDNTELMEHQMQRYRDENYPEHNGMIDSGMLVREIHDEKVINVMNRWWEEVRDGSRRDQLSFNYSCWKEDYLYDTSDLFIYQNQYIKLYNHT